MDLSKVVGEVEKKFGKGSVMNMEEKVEGIQFISTGSLACDIALSGGWPKGRIIEIYGPESSGKTTLAIHAMVEAQKETGKAVGVIDAEHAFDKGYAEALGLKTDKENFLFSQPDNGEQGLEIAEMMVKSGQFAMVLIDSVAALTPKAELEGDMGDSKMGLQARLMSQALRKMTGVISKTDTVVIFINQLREKIGVMFGSPETTTGGNALKFYASVRIDIRRCGQEKDGEEVIANKTRIKVIKNKVAPPYRKAEFNIEFGTGIDKIAEIIDIGVEYSVIEKKGSWYAYGDSKLGQGAAGVKAILEDNPELREEITLKIYETLGL